MEFIGFKIVFKKYIPEYKIITLLKEHVFYKEKRNVFFHIKFSDETKQCVLYWGLCDFNESLKIDIEEAIKEAEHSIFENFNSYIAESKKGVMNVKDVFSK